MKLPMSGLPLGYAKNQLAEEIAAGHDLVRLRGLGQVEGFAHHTVQSAIARHVHHGREAPAASRAAAHQSQRTALEDRQVERDLAPAGRSGDDETAAGLQARAALVPHGRADAVEHHVHAAAASQLLDALAELRRRRVVDHLVGAQLLGLGELPVAASRDDRAGADTLGHQETEAADAAADRLDEHVLPRLQLHALDETVPRRVARQRKRRGLLEAHAVGDQLQIGRRSLAILRVAAVELAAEPLLALAVLVAPENTRLAGAALHAVLDHDAIALFPAGHAGSQPRDLSCDVETENARKRPRGRAARADREVGVVDGRRPDAHDDLAGPRVGIGPVAVDQLLEAAGLGDVDGLHRKIAWHLGALKIQVSTQSTSSILAPTSDMAPARHTQFSTSCWPDASMRSRGRSRHVS